ncbi:MAG TPA: hypothetical protein VFJ50_03280 [Gemmatimonadales bacterium]|nr:hypothetical protein [Gemmatimonadales bacterium]
MATTSGEGEDYSCSQEALSHGVASQRLLSRVASAGMSAATARIDALASSLVESVNALASVVKAQSVEVADLRRRLDGVRSLLD